MKKATKDKKRAAKPKRKIPSRIALLAAKELRENGKYQPWEERKPEPFVPQSRESWPSLSVVIPCEKCGPIKQGGGAFSKGQSFDTLCEMAILAKLDIHAGVIECLIFRCERCGEKIQITADASGVHWQTVETEEEETLDLKEIDYQQMTAFLTTDVKAARRFALWKTAALNAGLGSVERGLRAGTLGRGSTRLGDGTAARMAAAELRAEGKT